MEDTLPEEGELAGIEVMGKWLLKDEVGRGRTSVVYRADHTAEEVDIIAACKLMPKGDLRDGWEAEIDKSWSLDEHPNVVSLKDYDYETIESREFVCIVSEFVNGPSLKDYVRENAEDITLPFIQTVIETILEVLHGMKRRGIHHNDLHTGNVLLSESDLLSSEQPLIKVTDFGIGGSHNSLSPKDDYVQLGDIILDLLEVVDKDELDSSDRFFYNFLIDEFVDKRVLETDPTKGEFVRSPIHLREILLGGRSQAEDKLEAQRNVQLDHPFEYLSCEQMGDSFELIESLYSKNFPGYGRVQNKLNTLLTGPRGCGKTTILKNMALETKIEAGSVTSIDSIEYVGIYYPCRDLYFAFHYLGENPSPDDRELLVHYFSLSLLKEFIETLDHLREEFSAQIPEEALSNFESDLSHWLVNYDQPPSGTDILHHLESVLNKEKNKVGTALRRDPSERPEQTLPVDFLAPACRQLINGTEWGSGTPIFFLIDDYSLPTISEPMQGTLNDLIMDRWDQVFFKVSTESITAFHPRYSSGKLIEESREFEAVDLAAHFIGEDGKKRREEFLTEVINTRLENTPDIDEKYKNISKILGENPYPSYNALAKQIRSDERVLYSGFGTLCDIFSGDLSEILRLIRGMFETSGNDEEWENGSVELPISKRIQNRIIREYSASFLNKIESVPDTGTRLRRIAEVFGGEAHQLLQNENSKNVTGNPPAQAFRIEIRESFSFEPNPIYAEVAGLIRKRTGERRTQEELAREAEIVYSALLRYGVFLLDVRGKSIRGSVVPRLFLRRLLLPAFNLTPSQRDSIRIEASEFLHLLTDPDGFALGDIDRPQDRSLLDYNNREED